MLTVHIVLHHSRHGGMREIARMKITNDATGTRSKGNYAVQTLGLDEDDGFTRITDEAEVLHYARESLPVWYLVMCALHALGYVVPEDVDTGHKKIRHPK